MKPLEQLSNVEKAKLLHELFPGEIPALLEYVQGVSAAITERQEQERQNWNNGLFTFDFWLTLLEDADRKIKRYEKQMHKSSRLFADQLFDGYIAVYMVHCLSLYTQTRKHANSKFMAAVDLLFNA